jgi:hypothetical protein
LSVARGFPIYSTSVITHRIARLGRVLRRAPVARVISRGGVYNCRSTAGTSLWSAHAFGDAIDLFPEAAGREIIERIGTAVVRNATRRTIANRGRPVKGIIFVAAWDREWIRGSGWRSRGKADHTGHVHAAGSFSTSKRPPCAS